MSAGIYLLRCSCLPSDKYLELNHLSSTASLLPSHGSNVVTPALKTRLLLVERKCFFLGIALGPVTCPSVSAKLAELKFGQTKMMWGKLTLKLAER